MAARKVRSEVPSDIELQDGDTVQLKDVLRITEYYKSNIRPHAKQEELGSHKALKRAFEHGITPQQIWTAMKHYEADPFRKKANSIAYVKTMRSFFTVDNIKAWQEPRKLPAFHNDPAIELLTRLDEQPPTPRTVTVKHEATDDSDSKFFEL
jgi:hypothetical protein